MAQCVDRHLADNGVIEAGGVQLCGIEIESCAVCAMSAFGCGRACRRTECSAGGCREQEAQYWNCLAGPWAGFHVSIYAVSMYASILSATGSVQLLPEPHQQIVGIAERRRNW